jgi:hypothetical protein
LAGAAAEGIVYSMRGRCPAEFKQGRAGVMRGKWISAAVVVLIACGFASSAPGEEPVKVGAPVSEIGPSVQFDSNGQQRFALSDFRGKLVVVVYFQSWCGICNGWSPRLFSQIEQAAGDRRDVVLLAVKTDGGGWMGAISYLKTRIADPSRWLIASDREATWYQVSMGTDELYNYMVIGPDGKVVSRGEAGMFYTAGPDKDKFVLPKNLNAFIQQAHPETILPKDKTYHESLKPAVRAAELRQFAIAWQLCAKPSKDAATSAAELKKDLTDWAAERVKALTAVLEDTEAQGEAKLDAYVELRRIADGLSATEPGKTARKAAAAAAKDKAVAKEIQAETEYLALMSKAALAKKLVKNAEFASVLKALAKKHPDTRCGRMAEADATRIGG